jgi:hypothetical protein
VRRIVIGEGLCPFAAPVFDQLLIEAHLDQDEDALTQSLMDLMQQVVSTPDSELPTALFVAANAFQDFDRYWNWFDICDRLLVGMGYEGVIQLASFHPQYRFDGEAENDASHYTNRSPYPMIHIIRERDIEQALESVSFPERIPDRNRRHLRRLGYQGLIAAMPALAGWISNERANGES